MIELDTMGRIKGGPKLGYSEKIYTEEAYGYMYHNNPLDMRGKLWVVFENYFCVTAAPTFEPKPTFYRIKKRKDKNGKDYVVFHGNKYYAEDFIYEERTIKLN